MKRFLILLLFSSTQLFAQHDGCDKCSMLQEEYEAAVSPEKEKIYAFLSRNVCKPTPFLSPNKEWCRKPKSQPT